MLSANTAHRGVSISKIDVPIQPLKRLASSLGSEAITTERERQM